MIGVKGKKPEGVGIKNVKRVLKTFYFGFKVGVNTIDVFTSKTRTKEKIFNRKSPKLYS